MMTCHSTDMTQTNSTSMSCMYTMLCRRWCNTSKFSNRSFPLTKYDHSLVCVCRHITTTSTRLVPKSQREFRVRRSCESDRSDGMVRGNCALHQRILREPGRFAPDAPQNCLEKLRIANSHHEAYETSIAPRSECTSMLSLPNGLDCALHQIEWVWETIEFCVGNFEGLS